ncbi:hypothetical protein HZ326_22218 [Fusarium oxysporum f. sp. albedinis]|nr:hypothetical protein HZ326_22218 [Fusarium oxysporum f. sp. albedinis]
MIAHSVPSFRIARLHLLVCHKCHCTPDGPMHQLRGQLPAIQSLLFSLPPKSFRNCPNRPVRQRVLCQLAPSRYSSL